MNVFQRAREAITKAEDFCNWCDAVFTNDKSNTVQKFPIPQNKQETTRSKNDPIQPVVSSVEHSPENDGHSAGGNNKLSKWDAFERIIKVGEFLAFIAVVVTLRYAREQGNAAQGQLQEMQNQQRLDERAWVLATGITSATIARSQDGYVFNISFKNTGKTPAINVKSFCNWALSDKEIPKTDDVSPGWEDEGLSAPDSGGTIQPIRRIDRAYLEFPNFNGYPIYIYGTIRYDDIFTNSHWSQFCYRVICHPINTGETEFTGWKSHNSCDEAQNNQTR